MQHVQDAWNLQENLSYWDPSESLSIGSELLDPAFASQMERSLTSGTCVDDFGFGQQSQQQLFAAGNLTQGSFFLPCYVPPAYEPTCQNENGLCRCGDDCICQGCVLHHGHNAIPCDQETLGQAFKATRMRFKQQQQQNMAMTLGRL